MICAWDRFGMRNKMCVTLYLNHQTSSKKVIYSLELHEEDLQGCCQLPAET
jgi:hypothetical protein